jgi:mono/diheme cytochrome c family protein
VRPTRATLIAFLLAAPIVASAQEAKTIDTGRRIYQREKCAVCHQIAGRGNSRFPLDGVGTRLSADELRRWFTHTVEMEAAKARKPAIEMSSRKYNFSNNDLEALVAFLLSLK